MNQSQIHPALRQTSLSSPTKPTGSQYPDGTPSVYSPIQPSPNTSYQNLHASGYYQSAQQAQDSPEEQSPGLNPADPNDLKRPRACEACRQLKVKCEPDDSSPTGSCKRCAKAHRHCVVTVPSRKRQKKTDSRVAELEKKIDALTASLAARGSHDTDVALDPAIAQHQNTQPRSAMYADQWQSAPSQHVHAQSPTTPIQSIGIKRKYPDSLDFYGNEISKQTRSRSKSPLPVPQFHATYTEAKPRQDYEDAPYIDVIDRNLIDAKTAYRCFDRYTSEMCIQLPIVVFPSDQSAEDVRKSRPILFLAVLAVGSGTIRPDLQPRLTSEATRILGDRIVYTGEKSLELVQAIQLITVFYQPPERYEELNFNQLIHIAAVMAMDIGMGKRSKKGPYPVWKGYPDKNKSMPDPNSAETRRCWLGCYYMCTNSAMSLRRPLLIRWSAYTDECLQILATAKDALPSDRWLCHLVKAQHIGEEIGVEFSMDDPASVLSLTDSKTQRHLKFFEQSLAEWREAGGEMMNSPVMKHTEAIHNLYMHEIAMHHNHNIDDFKPPYNTAPIEGPPDPDSVTPAHVESLTACLRSAHNAFEAFLSMDTNTLRALPTHFFVRNSYAAVALIKLYSAVVAKGSKFGSTFKADELKVDLYLDRLIQILHRVAEGGMSKVAYKFTLIFTTLRNWHLKRTETPPHGSHGRASNQQIGPEKHDAQEYKTGQLALQHDPPPAWTAQNRIPAEHNLRQPHQHQQPQQSQQQPQQRTGLQMLSDAAMGPSNSMTPQEQWIPQAQMGQLQAMPGISGMSMSNQDFNMMAGEYGQPGDPIVMGGFTSDDFMAFGLGDDWANFGFNQDGAWAY